MRPIRTSGEIKPCQQGRGCGKALLMFARRWARKQGYCELALDMPANASHLVDFYVAQEFRVVGKMRKPGRN